MALNTATPVKAINAMGFLLSACPGAGRGHLNTAGAEVLQLHQKRGETGGRAMARHYVS